MEKLEDCGDHLTSRSVRTLVPIPQQQKSLRRFFFIYLNKYLFCSSFMRFLFVEKIRLGPGPGTMLNGDFW